MSKSDCCVPKSGREVVIKQGCAVLRIDNGEGAILTVCDVDGCLIDDASERCDVLVKFDRVASLLVELKGRDIEKAKSQLEATLKHANMRDELSGQLSAIIVCSKVRVPRFNAFLLRSKQEFARKYHCRFHVKTSGCTVEREKVCAS